MNPKIANARRLITLGGRLVPFIATPQRLVLIQNLLGEEAEWFADLLIALDARIQAMPKTYETDGTDTLDKVVHLHYFGRSADAWVIELDVSAEQDQHQHHQAMGLQRLDPAWPAGVGYISIPEIIGARLELDLHFKPCTVRELGVETE